MFVFCYNPNIRIYPVGNTSTPNHFRQRTGSQTTLEYPRGLCGLFYYRQERKSV